MSRLILVVRLAILFQLLITPAKADVQPPRIEAGSIHLRKSDIMSEAVTLDGLWHFTFQGQKTLMEVPGSWTRGDFPRFGVGIYELDIEFDEDVESIALRSDHFATEYRILVNGKLVAGPEQFTQDADQVLAVHPSVISLPIHSRRLHLRIEVSNQIDQIAGIIRPIMLGTPTAILKEVYFRKLMLIPIMSVFGLLLLYFILVSTRKEHRYPALILSGCCLCTIIFFAVQYAFFSEIVAPWSRYIHLFDLGWFGAAYFFGIYNSNVFRWNLPRWYTRGFQQLPLLIYLVTVLLPLPIRSQILIIMHVQILISVAVNFSMTLRSVKKKTDGAVPFLVTSIMLLVAACNDILFASGTIQSIYMFGYVFVIYLLAQGFLLARRHSALIIESANAQLLKSQIVLSQKISGNVERFEIDHPALNWSSVFLPSEDAGGDWVYFKQQRGQLYFFLADVTDHGFHSALMTLVLSSSVIAVLDEYSASSEHPMNVLEKCASVANSAVCRVGPSLHKFSTMSLHCLDLDQGVISYIQAGHMPTLVSSGTKLKVLMNSHSILGSDPGHTFKAKAWQLQPGDKVFAYTDGLTENIFDSARGPLRQKKLIEILLQARDSAAIKEALDPFLQGPHRKDTDDTAFIAIQWVHTTLDAGKASSL